MRHTTRSVVLPPPPAGSDLSYLPAGGQGTRLLALAAALTTSATVANRTPVLRLQDQDGNTVWQTAAATAQTATTAWTYSASSTGGAAESGSAQTAGVVSLAMPDLWVPAGWAWSTLTGGLQAADQWSGLVAVVETGVPEAEIERRILLLEQAVAAL